MTMLLSRTNRINLRSRFPLVGQRYTRSPRRGTFTTTPRRKRQLGSDRSILMPQKVNTQHLVLPSQVDRCRGSYVADHGMTLSLGDQAKSGTAPAANGPSQQSNDAGKSTSSETNANSGTPRDQTPKGPGGPDDVGRGPRQDNGYQNRTGGPPRGPAGTPGPGAGRSAAYVPRDNGYPNRDSAGDIKRLRSPEKTDTSEKRLKADEPDAKGGSKFQIRWSSSLHLIRIASASVRTRQAEIQLHHRSTRAQCSDHAQRRRKARSGW